MATMYVVIKGNDLEAKEAAEKHGLQLRIGAYRPGWHQPEQSEVMGLIEMTVDQANAWLCEWPTEPPFPVGSLLYWAPWVRPLEQKQVW